MEGLTDEDKENFDQLCAYMKHGKVCLIDSTDAVTKEPVAVIALVMNTDDDDIYMLPIARMISGDPFTQLIPPDVMEHVQNPFKS